MTPETAQAMYRQQIDEHGELITLRREGSSDIDVPIRARVIGYSPEEMAAGITQGHRKVIFLAEDVEASGFPTPIKPKATDKALVRGKLLSIEDVDDNTRRVAGVLIAYELRVKG